MVLKKYNLDWENRYEIISIELRNKIIDELKEPFKKRGLEREELINEHPRLIDENGNKTSKLIITSNKYLDGHIIYDGSDEKGVYSLFQPKNRLENEKWKYVKDKSEKLSKLYFLQIELTETNINYSKIQNVKDEIDFLFDDIFKINNVEKNNKKEFPKYCEIGSLFAQGLISINKGYFYYKKRKFESAPEISRFLKKEILKIDTDIRQYIDATLKKGGKSFYNSKRMKIIIEYCKFNNIEITEDFQSKYNDLINLH